MPTQERESEQSHMTLPLYLFVAFSIFALLMVLLALAGARNAREIASMLGIAPHRPVTMILMLLSLVPSIAFAACAAYPLVWPESRQRTLCLVGAGIALLLAASLCWSPAVMRMLQAFAG